MFKPLLAPRECPKTKAGFLENLPYPLLISPKYDGIRAITKAGSVKSRTFKDLPSQQVQRLFSPFPELDGELIVGAPTDHDVYNRTQSHVMSGDKPAAQIRLFVFDWALESAANIPFQERLQESGRLVKAFNDYNTGDYPLLVPVPHWRANNVSQLLDIENEILPLGFEGLMMRGALGRYKHGRATYNDGIIYKLKRSTDDEGVLASLEEGLHNGNELEVNELGGAKRSHHQDNKVPNGRVGVFLVKFQGQIIRIAPGNFTHDELKEIWENPEKFLGRILKFRHFEHGVKELPRHGRALGFRDPMDM